MFIDRMAEHRQFITGELQILELAKLTDHDRRAVEHQAFSRLAAEKLEGLLKVVEANQETESRSAVVGRIRAWLAPPPFARALEDCQAVRESGTADWILEDPTFLEWTSCQPQISSDDKMGRTMPPWVLWVNGKLRSWLILS